METSQSFSSLEVPTIGSAPQVLSTITASTAYSPPKQPNEGLSTMFETGGSSSILEYSPARPSLDEASIRLVKHLAQHNPTSSYSKGILFIEECAGDDKSSTSDLREEIEDEEKTKQIKDLQTNLGLVTASYFNLKNVEYDAFGEKVKALFQQPHGVDDPPTTPTQSVSEDFPVDPPARRTTTTVNRFGKEPEGSRARITIKQGKRTITTNKRDGLLFMKN
ncbi:unnamed protein product [Lactuca saligna]|uniref:Uncharacterized protein n=1 Tax=Lactuca saligna TaxID=75948 RepID=A0AA35VGH8_LACSI|nr:unnamed protein product [Lactuca saligna]